MHYEWILFDADHTLFDFDRSAKQSLQATLQEFGHPHKNGTFEIYDKINKSYWRAFERGNLTREELKYKRFQHFFAEIGVEDDPVRFHDAYLSKLPQFPYFLNHAMAILRRVKSSAYHMGVITNGLKEVQRPRLVSAQILDYFDIVVISGEIGHAKPSTAYFQYAYDAMDRPVREKVLVVGDSLHSDIKGGNDFGFQTCWYNPNGAIPNEDVRPDFQIQSLKALEAMLF